MSINKLNIVSGITGNVSIDTNGDRNADYSLLDMEPTNGTFVVSPLIRNDIRIYEIMKMYSKFVLNPQVVAHYSGKKKAIDPVPDQKIHWPGGRIDPPPDTPKCGFDGHGCPSKHF